MKIVLPILKFMCFLAIKNLQFVAIFNSSLYNFDKRYDDELTAIFYQWPKLYFGLNVETKIHIFNGI